jgi:hypothetical protein
MKQVPAYKENQKQKIQNEIDYYENKAYFDKQMAMLNAEII